VKNILIKDLPKNVRQLRGLGKRLPCKCSVRIIMNKSAIFRVKFPDVSGLALHQWKTMCNACIRQGSEIQIKKVQCVRGAYIKETEVGI